MIPFKNLAEISGLFCSLGLIFLFLGHLNRKDAPYVASMCNATGAALLVAGVLVL